MKKLLVLALLIASVTFIFAVESDFSDVVGYVKYECISNANGDASLVALSMNSGYTLASELGADYPEITSVSTWNNDLKGWETAVNYGDGFWWPDASLSPNQPFFVSVSANVDVFIAGSLNDPVTLDLTVNGNGDSNLIALPVDSSHELASSLGTEIAEMTSLSSWNNELKGWDTAVNYGDGFWWPDAAISRAGVYFVSVSANSSWPNVGRTFTNFKTIKANRK